MLNDLPWRKIPRDLLTNPKVRTIARKYDVALRPVIFAFYAACLTQADDDGVIDLTDYDVYADLLMIEDETLVKELASKFVERGFLSELSPGKFLLLDWESPVRDGKRAAETAEQRRSRVQAQIDAAENKNDNFFCPERDKKQKNVAKTEKRQTDKTVKTEIKETDRKDSREKKDTHTQEIAGYSADAESFALTANECFSGEETELMDAGLLEATATESHAEKPKEKKTVAKSLAEEASKNSDNVQDGTVPQWTFEDTKKACTQMNVPERVAGRLVAMKSYDDWQTVGVLYNFFRSHNKSDWDKSELMLTGLQKIVLFVQQMAEPKNPGYVIAGQLVAAFLDLTTNKGEFGGKAYEYFTGMIMSPVSMMYPSVWPRLINRAKKILEPGKTAGERWQQQMQTYADLSEKYPATNNGDGYFEAECKKLGLDPKAKGSLMQYLATISANKRSQDTA